MPDHLSTPVARFLTQLRADGRSSHTVLQYQRHLRLFGQWCGREAPSVDICAIDHSLLASFLASEDARVRPDGQPKRASSMNALRTSVRGFFDYLHRAGDITSDPGRVVRMARVPETRPRPLRPTEVVRFQTALEGAVTVAERRDRQLFGVLLETGLRLDSALSAAVGDADLWAGELNVQRLKGGGELTVFLNDRARVLLEEAVGDRSLGPLFPGNGGGRLSTRHVQRRFDLWLERARIPKRYSPHSLRHTFATQLYERTGDILVVQEALGHKSISSTMVYARASPSRVRAAVGASMQAESL